jgi:trigger factor
LSNTSEEAWAAEARPQAEERVKRGLLLAEVIEQEELGVETEEIEAEIEEMIEPLGERGEQLREMFSSPAGRMSITERVLTRKAIERLKAIARGENPPKGSSLVETTEVAAESEPEAEAETPEGQAEVAPAEARAPPEEGEEAGEVAAGEAGVGEAAAQAEVSVEGAAEVQDSQQSSEKAVETSE